MITIRKDYKIIVSRDEDPSDPREWSNACTMVCAHRRHVLGDVQKKTIEEMNELEQSLKAVGAYILPLYLYDHSGLTMRTSPFHCPWDSGRIGFAYITKETMKSEWNFDRLSPKRKIFLSKIIDGEVQTYNDYLHGNVYRYEIKNKKGEVVDSCSGFYPNHKDDEEDYAYALEEAMDAVDGLPEQDGFSLDAGRVVKKNGTNLFYLRGIGEYNPTELDKLARRVVELLERYGA